MSEEQRDNTNTPAEVGATTPPRRPTNTEAPNIGALVVASPGTLARFVPPGTGSTVSAPTDPDDQVVLIARLPLGAVRNDGIIVGRFDHASLRVVGAAAARLIVLTSDGPALAAALGVPETTVTLAEDGGMAMAVARLAAAIGLAPHTGWPEEEAGRLAILLQLLHASGHHPRAPARMARLFAYALAINAEPVPVPLTGDELIRTGRVAGFGAEALAPGFALDGAWPAHLSAEERAAMPDEAAVRALFREAARALARIAPVTPRASEPTEA